MLLTPLQAVLALFNSLGCGSPAPPSSQVFEHEKLGAEGESQPSLQDMDHLVPHLGQVDLRDDAASHGGQQGAVHADYAAAASGPHADAVASSPPALGLMSAASAGDRACIREWMQVEQPLTSVVFAPLPPSLRHSVLQANSRNTVTRNSKPKCDLTSFLCYFATTTSGESMPAHACLPTASSCRAALASSVASKFTCLKLTYRSAPLPNAGLSPDCSAACLSARTSCLLIQNLTPRRLSSSIMRLLHSIRSITTRSHHISRSTQIICSR